MIQPFGRRLDHLISVLEGGRGGFSTPNLFDDIIRLVLPAFGSWRWQDAAGGSVVGAAGATLITAFTADTEALVYVPYAIVEHDDAVARRTWMNVRSIPPVVEITVAGGSGTLAQNDHLVLSRPILVPPGAALQAQVTAIGAGNVLRIRWMQLSLAIGEETFTV